MAPRLSVVLSTYNRAASLRHALAALLRQTADRDACEIVVVSNNCTDDTDRVVASLADSRLRLLHEPRQGLSFGRNTGIEAARGAVVAFTDDDVTVAPDWVATLLRAFDASPSVDGVGGRVEPGWEVAPPPWLTSAHWAPLALQDHGPASRVFDRATPIGLIGANVAFRRDVFDRIGGFATDVQRVGDGVGSTEDHEFLTRLYQASGRMLYEPALVVTARVQPDRCTREYHRRWHTGHGRFHARMREESMERSNASIFGVPGHLLRAGLRDLSSYLSAAATRNPDAVFDAELKLRFLRGFVTERLTSPTPVRIEQTGMPRSAPASGTGVPPLSGDASRPTADASANLAADAPPFHLVSVIVPCYNHGHFLADALRSVDTAGHPVEVVVVDDGSADETSSVVRRFPHVRYVRQANEGLAAARNRGLREAEGEFVIFLDADDRLLPGAIPTGAAHLAACGARAMVFGRCVMMDEGGALLPTPGQARIEGSAHAAFLRNNPVWMPGMAMFRRDALLRAGGFSAGFDAAADYDLYLRLSRDAPVHDHGEVVAAYRRHGANMSGNATRMLRETTRVLRRYRPAEGGLRPAWAEGMMRWKAFYGTHLVEEIRAHRRRHELRAMAGKAITLAALHPRLAFSEARKKLALART